MKKKLSLVLAAVLLSWAACSKSEDAQAAVPAPHGGNYNIIFITTDQERYFDTPPGGTAWRARELLQSIGVTFEKHYISSNMSASSRSVMYTGQHITATKMADNTEMPWQDEFSPHITNIGHIMLKAGYYTAYKGKFHLLNEGVNMDPNAEPEQQTERIQRQNDLEVYGFSDWNFEGDMPGNMLEGYHKDEYIKSAAVRWLREKGAGLNESGVPFFLAVNFINPHDIMFYNPNGQQTAMPTSSAPNNAIYRQSYHFLPPAWEHESGISAHREFHDGWRFMYGSLSQDHDLVIKHNDYYLNCIQDQDNSLLGLLEELQRLGMMDNTIIIFTSDHGEMAGSYGQKGKGPFMFEYNIHVPFIIFHPAFAGEPSARGRRINAVTSHLDIVPTILDMTNLPAGEKERLGEGLAGRSLMPLLDGSAQSVRDGALYVYSMLATLDSNFNLFSAAAPDFTKRGLLRGIVTERYKFARYFSPLNFNTPETLDDLYDNNDVELYDLETDPHELNNLAVDRAANGELIAEMNRRLNTLIALEIGFDNGEEISAGLRFFRSLNGKAF